MTDGDSHCDTTLYPTGVPGFYAAEFGSATVQVCTERRTVELFLDPVAPDMTDGDYDELERALSSLGIVGFHESWTDEDGLVTAIAYT
jgi:hypothetical protein